MARHPSVSPCAKAHQLEDHSRESTAETSQLRLNLSRVLKLQGLTKRRCSAGSQE